MAFLHGKNAAVFFNDNDLSGFFNDASASQSVETSETTTFGNNSKTYVVGLEDGTLSLSGLFDGSAGAVDEIMQATLGVENSGITTFVYGGATPGNRATLSQTETTSYDVSSPVGDVVSASAELQSDGGIDRGIQLTPLTGISATGNEAAQNNGASSANGGVAHLHVLSNTHDDAAVVRVQHSVDGSSFVDLVTFTTVATLTTTSQRSVVAAGTTVNQHIRAEYTLSGSSGSISISVSFARR